MKIKYIQWQAVINNKLYRSPKYMINGSIAKEDIKALGRVFSESFINSLENITEKAFKK